MSSEVARVTLRARKLVLQFLNLTRCGGWQERCATSARSSATVQVNARTLGASKVIFSLQ